VIIPSLLAITYLGQSIYFHLILEADFNLSPLATWLVPVGGATTFAEDLLLTATWGNTSRLPPGSRLTLAGLIASMTVNALATGMIVFKILKVFLEIKTASSTSVSERTLGSLRQTTGEGTTLRHVIFIIIESGMTLFAIQLIRVVLSSLPVPLPVLQAGQTLEPVSYAVPVITIGLNIVVVINQMFNVIIRSVHFYFFVLLIITFTTC
jgi:hypothetical protein